MQVVGVPTETKVPGAQSRWLQALARQVGEEEAHECDTPFPNKQLCLSLTSQSTEENSLACSTCKKLGFAAKGQGPEDKQRGGVLKWPCYLCQVNLPLLGL